MIKGRIAEMSDDQFKTKVQSTYTRLAVQDTKLAAAVARTWVEIATRRFVFDRQPKSLELLNTLKKEELIAYFEDKFYTNPRILEYSVISQQRAEEQKTDIEERINKIYKERNFSVLASGTEGLAKLKSKLMLHADPFKG